MDLNNHTKVLAGAAVVLDPAFPRCDIRLYHNHFPLEALGMCLPSFSLVIENVNSNPQVTADLGRVTSNSPEISLIAPISLGRNH